MSVRLVIGDDAVLLSEAMSKLINELTDPSDRTLTVIQLYEDDLRLPEGDWSLQALIDAAQTPPFLTDKRVVVGRHLTRFGRAADVKPLVNLLDELLDTTDLVLVWERGQDPASDARLPAVPRSLTDKVSTVGGEIIDVRAPRRKAQAGKWLRDQIADYDLRFRPDAVKALASLVGEDRSIVVGCLRTLLGALGPGAEVTAEDVAIYGGDPGSVAPWDLDDAIDRGDIRGALEVLHRQLPSRHPFQLLAALHRRYQRMLQLDGSGVSDESQAAKVLDMRGSTFPARKLLNQSRKLGYTGIAQAIDLLAEADLALRGTLDWPAPLVMEVLVARLSNLSRR